MSLSAKQAEERGEKKRVTKDQEDVGPRALPGEEPNGNRLDHCAALGVNYSVASRLPPKQDVPHRILRLSLLSLITYTYAYTYIHMYACIYIYIVNDKKELLIWANYGKEKDWPIWECVRKQWQI